MEINDTFTHQVLVTKTPFISKIWYGNPQNEWIEGTLTGTEMIFAIAENTKDINKQSHKTKEQKYYKYYNEAEWEVLKQYIWECNYDNTYIKTNKLCCINIKNKFSINEFIQAISTYLSSIVLIRVFKSALSDLYHIYLEFTNAEFCNIFFNTYHFSKFNPVENEYLFFVEIENVKLEETFKTTKHHQWSPIRNKIRKSSSGSLQDMSLNINTNTNSNYNNIGDNISTCSWEDGKVCSICIENIDKGCNKGTEGIIYVLCGHTFHWSCFFKWEDDKCPLCRYYLSPANVSTCELCTSEKDLWMCWVCGYISCGEEHGNCNHRVEHYKNMGHVYVQGWGENHKVIFDFTKNAPVHIWIHNSIWASIKEQDIKAAGQESTSDNANIITNNSVDNSLQTDTEIISTTINHSTSSPKTPVSNSPGNNIANTWDSVPPNSNLFKSSKEKVEYIMSEYNSIISSQWENQRLFYLEKIRDIERNCILEQKEIDANLEKSLEEIKLINTDWEQSETLKNEALGKVKNKNWYWVDISNELKATEEEFNKLSKEKKQIEERRNMKIGDIDVLIQKEESKIMDLNQQIKDLRIHMKTMNNLERRNDCDDIKNASWGVLLDVEDPNKKRSYYGKYKK